jgi:hypothetical protein
MKRIIYLLFLALLISSCSKQVIQVKQNNHEPYYVTVQQLNVLEIGMTKNQVSKKLNVPPFDVFHSLENGCELYSYKYKHKDHEVSSNEVETKRGLNGGQDYYPNKAAGNVFLYFKDNQLVDLVTESYKEFADFGKTLEPLCSIESIEGCIDPNAINYNEKAIFDNNSCEYCPCDFVKNPDYDENCSNSKKCISILKLEKDKEAEFDYKLKKLEKISQISDSCTFCDLINEIAYPYIIENETEESSPVVESKAKAKNVSISPLSAISKIKPGKSKSSGKLKKSDYKKSNKKTQKKSLWKRTRWYIGAFIFGAILI